MILAHVFASQSWGGAEIYCLELAHKQHLSGRSVFVWGLPNSKITIEARKRRIPVIESELPLRIDPTELIPLSKIVRSYKITHLQIHWSGGLWAFAGIKFLLPVKVIYHVHLWIKHSKKDPLHWLLYKTIDRTIVAGERAQKAAQKKLPISKNRIQVVSYAIDMDPVKALMKVTARELRAELNLPQDKFIFAVFARIDKQKGWLEFLKAFLELKKTDAGVFALLIGDPSHNEKEADDYEAEVLKFLSQNFSNTDYLKLPNQKEFQKYLKACDILVAPSYHESYSLMFLHAFSLGIPVISTSSGGTPDLVTLDRGWLVPPKSVSELSKSMKVAKDSVQKSSLDTQAIIQSTWAEHSFENIMKEFDQIYEMKD
jgi:glycosyltransferase involved in cell wall biosynthesis